MVFCLSVGTCHKGLFLITPRYKIRSKENAEPIGRTAVIQITSLVIVAIGT